MTRSQISSSGQSPNQSRQPTPGVRLATRPLVGAQYGLSGRLRPPGNQADGAARTSVSCAITACDVRRLIRSVGPQYDTHQDRRGFAGCEHLNRMRRSFYRSA